MKLTILSAGRRVLQLGSEDLKNKVRFEDLVKLAIFEPIADRFVKISPGLMRKLVKRLIDELTAETALIDDIIFERFREAPLSGRGKGSVIAFTSKDLMKRSKTASSGQYPSVMDNIFTGEMEASVRWKNLSNRWIRDKERRTSLNAERFFVNTGQLGQQLRKIDIAQRAGGFSIDSELSKNDRGSVIRTGVMQLGDLQVTIFPRLNASMLPMLASGRWTDTNNGYFEEQFFPNRMGEKLSGPQGRQGKIYRPLVLPILQFFLAYRIPRAINRAVTSYSRNRTEGGG